jgi:hypothetical protein
MPSQPCATCQSTLGYYQGPNGTARCLNCFHDQDFKTPTEDPPPEPNASGTTVAIASAKPDRASDKAMRGPKEPST